MSERDYLAFFVWFLAFMVAVGGMIPSLWPSLVRFVNRQILKEDDRPADSGH